MGAITTRFFNVRFGVSKGWNKISVEVKGLLQNDYREVVGIGIEGKSRDIKPIGLHFHFLIAALMLKASR